MRKRRRRPRAKASVDDVGSVIASLTTTGTIQAKRPKLLT